jgi:hypothetical protein
MNITVLLNPSKKTVLKKTPEGKGIAAYRCTNHLSPQNKFIITKQIDGKIYKRII